MPEIICFVAACSDMGKTTFLEKLIREFKQREIKTGAIKSDSHGFEIDVPKKDSWRLKEAGASVTGIIGPNRFAIISDTQEKKHLDDILTYFKDVDIVLAEGFKYENRPQIEIIREEKSTKVTMPDKNLIAVITDIKNLVSPVPVFNIDDIKEVADFIANKYLKHKYINL